MKKKKKKSPGLKNLDAESAPGLLSLGGGGELGGVDLRSLPGCTLPSFL